MERGCPMIYPGSRLTHQPGSFIDCRGRNRRIVGCSVGSVAPSLAPTYDTDGLSAKLCFMGRRGRSIYFSRSVAVISTFEDVPVKARKECG